MDSYEAAQLVFARVKLLEPEHVTKIMGYLLLQDHTNTEMFSLAFCTDADLKEAVAKAKKHVLSSSSPALQRQQQQLPADQERPSLSTSSTRIRSSKGTDFVSKEDKRPNPSRKPGKEHRLDNAASAKAPEDASLPCKYFFARGYCKLGSSCRFMHDGEPPVPDTSRQLYLTFQSDSRFSEKDVLLYFSTYGPVEEVRIPAQPKRMFGFIAFQHPETVRAILNDNNPHYVCGSRVLVKPYREKPFFKSYERKKTRDTDTGDNLIGSDAVRRAEEERALELERRHLVTDTRAKPGAIAAARKARALSAYRQPEPLKARAPGPVNYLYPLLSNGHSYSGPLVKPVAALPDFGDPCCMCYELFVDPIQLDCSHTFCIPCIVKAVKSSEDECPICHTNISDQVYKMLHTGDMQPWLSSPPPPPLPPPAAAAAASAAGFTSLPPLATDKNRSMW